MKEIGSEFWSGCTPLDGNGVKMLLPKGFNTLYTLSGRTGLDIIVSDILTEQNRSLKVYMPSYCCHTMIEPFVSHKVKIEFYDVIVGSNGIQKEFNTENDCDIVFLMDYFGFIDSQTAEICKNQKEKNKIIIYDATHSFFCYDMDYCRYDYVYGSFRKWVGVNAGFCSKQKQWIHTSELIQNTSYTNLRNVSFKMKAKYMSGEKIDKHIFLKNFSAAEDYLETDYKHFAPDNISIDSIYRLNVDFLRKRRRENAEQIINVFSDISGAYKCIPQTLSKYDCPLFVPLDIQEEKRYYLRNYLIQNSYYLPIHWPISELHHTNDVSKYLYNHELSCVCDQRYKTDDIQRLTTAIKNFNRQKK